MSTQLTAEDIAAARREGDLRRLVLMAAGVAPAVAPARPANEPRARLARSRPGAWPDGTRPPAPVPAAPPGAWAAAVERYRGGAETNGRCACGGCDVTPASERAWPPLRTRAEEMS